jgi:hypothetical protein
MPQVQGQSSCGIATINSKLSRCHEGRFVTGQKDNALGDVHWQAEPAYRVLVAQTLHTPRGIWLWLDSPLNQRRVDETGSVNTTMAPSLWQALAEARPIPDAAPVTTTTLFIKRFTRPPPKS